MRIFQTKYFYGYVNKQNCHTWGSKNPQATIELPLHPQTVTFLCALSSGGVIFPYFFENAQGATVTVKSEHCDRVLNVLFGMILKISIYTICGSNKTVPQVIQQEKIGNYCKKTCQEL